MKLAILDANERFYADKCSLEKKIKQADCTLIIKNKDIWKRKIVSKEAHS